MWTRGLRGGRAAGLFAAAVLAVLACGLARPPDAAEVEADDSISAADLDSPGSILDDLDAGERDAYERSGMSGARPPTPPEAQAEEDEPEEDVFDKIGNATMSVLVVAVSAAAAAAPYLLF